MSDRREFLKNAVGAAAGVVRAMTIVYDRGM
jgi:hypothetical protein